MGHQYEQVVAFANLLKAAQLAMRGKRCRPDVAKFVLHLEPELHALQRALASRTYRPGPYRRFTICDKKPRLISAAPFRDRVVHHALCRIIQPVFERGFLCDSYACRMGKGTHAAVERASLFARRFRYVLKCDVAQYFASIDHAVLRNRLARRIQDEGVLWLIDRILEGGRGETTPGAYFPGDDLFSPWTRPCGLPLGNQTSQFFANVYLDGLDHFIKHELRMPGYVRYVDDLLVFANDKALLHDARAAIEAYGHTLRLTFHPRKCFVSPVKAGFTFLGFRLFPGNRRLEAGNVRRMKRRVRRFRQMVQEGRMPSSVVTVRFNSWLAHARHGDTARLRRWMTEYLSQSVPQWRL